MQSSRTHILVDLDTFANKLDFGVWVLHERSKTLLDTLHLLRDSTENTLLESVEFIEASPRADLTQSDEDTAHGLEIESFVTAED